MPGPLSMPCKDKVKFREYDTAAKRDEAMQHGGLITGKTAAVKAHHGVPADESAPKNLKKRLKAWKDIKNEPERGLNYHRPGSNKK
jgi:hypothetical protein